MTTFRLKLHCPSVKAQADTQQVGEVLGSSPGFDYVTVDLPSHTLLVTTANQDGGEDIIRKLKGAGFPPDEVEVTALTGDSQRSEGA